MNVLNTSLHTEANAAILGKAFQRRLRSDALLSDREVSLCRENGIPLAFDPLQLGWVPDLCEDDLEHFAKVSSAWEELSFRPWTIDDAPVLAKLLSSEALWRYLPESFAGPVDESTARQLIRLGSEAHHSVQAVILDGLPIGQVRLRFEDDGTSAELSYWLGEAYWGKGLGTAIVRDFCLTALRERPEISRLFAKVRHEHAASRRVLEKAYFNNAGIDGDWLILERLRSR